MNIQHLNTLKSYIDLSNTYFRTILGFIFAVLMYFPINVSTKYDHIISMFFVFILSFILIYYLYKSGHKRLIITFILLSILALCIETVGLVTGFPYSEFYYTQILGLKLFSITPIILLVSFSPLVFGAIYYASKLSNSKLNIAVLSVLILILFDLILDPVAVQMNYWVWIKEGSYYGIPFQNYLGWLFTGSISVIIYYLISKFEIIENQQYTLYFYIWIYTGASGYLGLVIPFLVGICLLVCIEFICEKKNYKESYKKS